MPKKHEAVAQIAQSAAQLHASNPPDAWAVASASSGPVHDGALGVGDDGARVCGPFATLQEFEELLDSNGVTEGFERLPGTEEYN